MFVVLYLFKIHNDKEQQFVRAWEDMTELIKKYEGGLGSRLHKKKDNEYVAYAQWPDRFTWEQSGSKLPKKAVEIRAIMNDVCIERSVIQELKVVKDLLEK